MIWAPTLLAKSIGDCAYHPSFFSDHRYMLLTFSTGDIFERGPGVWKFNTSLLEEANYLSIVRSFWSFWQTQETSLLFSSPLDWWDPGKFYLRELTCCYARNCAAEQSREKLQLSKRLKQLQRLFDGGDSAAFSELCAIQEELRGYICAKPGHLRSVLAVVGQRKEKHLRPSF